MSMSGAAQRSDDHFDLTPPEPSSLKDVAAQRLAAHRHRRAKERASEEASAAQARERADQARSASRRGADLVREAVQARYQQSQSYREFLAAEAERALQQAQAEAEVAARNAEAVAQAQAKLLADIETWENAPAKAQIRSELAHELADIALGARELMQEPPQLSIVESPKPMAGRGLTIRLHDDLEPTITASTGRPSIQPIELTDDELDALEQEIAFRHDPEFATPHVIEPEPIPANIIQFPRQLVAPRKARPRLAEGPLVEESTPEPQLRIFEVEAQQIAIEPEAVTEHRGAPEWQSLLLESTAVVRDVAPEEAQSNLTFEPQAAPVSQRLMAAAVDAACVLAAGIAFDAVAVYMTGSRLFALKPAVLAGSAFGSLAFFAIAFQMLCFTLSDATPGMRYARIALCTFADNNPTRKAMRLRFLATVLAACPLGMGLAWMWLDDDRLGWHDRISRMYQRAY